MENKDESRRRVSFAEKTEINYILYQKDSSTAMNSSTSLDASMDITTELADFKNLNLFVDQEQKPIENADEPGFDDVNTNIIPRKSLDPLKFIEFDSISENLENNMANPIEKEIKENTTETGENSLDEKDAAIEAKKEDPPSIFWRSSIKNNIKKEMNDSFEDPGMINSSFGVEELVNTIDLRKIIPQEWKEKVSVSEFLSSQGIRFLDETVINGMKRDTLSKSRNVVDPSLLIYYQYSLRERIEFLYSFSGFLIDKMKDLQSEIEEAESSIDINSLNKDNLKKIRNEARNKSKIDWYSLRKIYEIQFNKKMIENKNKAIEILNSTRKENTKITETLHIKKQTVDTLSAMISEMKNKVSSFEKENIQKTEKIQEMIDERKKVMEVAKSDLEKVASVFEVQQKEESIVQKRIEKLNLEILNLKKNLAIKNVTENQLNGIKKQVDRYNTIYQFNIIKMTKHNVLFEVYRNVISIGINSLLDVVSFSVVKASGDPFSEFARSIIQKYQNLKLRDFLRKSLEIYYICFGIKKEVDILKEKNKVECFYLNSSLYMRINTSENRECTDVTINECFDLYINGKIESNVKVSPGFLNKITTD